MAIFANNIEQLMNLMPIGSMQAPIVMIMAARTKREFTYKQKVMEHIMEKYKLKNVIGKQYTPHPVFYAEALRSNLGQHGFIATGGFQSTCGVADSAEACITSVKTNIPLKKKYIEKGALANDFGEGGWMSSYESGHYFHYESPTMFDQTKDHSVSGMTEYMEQSNQMHLLKHLGAPFFVETDRMHDMFGPHMNNHNVWLRKIKETFDPNNTADGGYYINPKKK